MRRAAPTRRTKLLAGILLGALPLASMAGCSASPSDGGVASDEALTRPIHVCPDIIVYCPPTDLRICHEVNGCPSCTCTVPPPSANVYTQHNDNARTGANLNEGILSTSSVTPTTFGKLHDWPVQGDVLAQPLFVSHAIAGHDALYVATEHNMVYALDATSTSASTPVLWQKSLDTPIDLTKTYGSAGNVSPEMGVTSTPVIDAATSTMYVVDATTVWNVPVFKIHALDIVTGNERPDSPVFINAHAPLSTGARFDFYANPYTQRAGLALGANEVFLGFGSEFGDGNPVGTNMEYRGWIMAFSKTTLQPTYDLITTPGDYQGGVWQAGMAPAIDSHDNVFYITGNPTHANVSSLGDSLVQLGLTGAGGARTVSSFFKPVIQYQGGDWDFGSSGPMVLPTGPDVVSGGKHGIMYVSRVGDLGGQAPVGGTDNVVSSVNVGGQVIGSPVFWGSASPTSGTLYEWASATDGGNCDNPQPLRSYSVTGGTLTYQSSSNEKACYYDGGLLSLSANGTTAGTGIIWANVPSSDTGSTLYAYDASNVQRVLWSADLHAPLNGQATSTGLGGRYAVPTVANGHVFLGLYDNNGGATPTGHVAVYGLH